MAIPDNAVRLVFSGSFGTTVERWAFGLWWSIVGTDPFDLPAGESTETHYVAFRTAFLKFLRPEDHFTDLDMYKYAGGVATTHTHASVSHAGTGSSSTLPPQNCLVLSLRTPLASRRGRGRIYLPNTSHNALAGTYLLDTTDVDGVVDALGDWLSALVALSTDWKPVVVSQTGSFATDITSVDADYVGDTQRRRRRSLRSARHSRVVTPD